RSCGGRHGPAQRHPARGRGRRRGHVRRLHHRGARRVHVPRRPRPGPRRAAELHAPVRRPGLRDRGRQPARGRHRVQRDVRQHDALPSEDARAARRHSHAGAHQHLIHHHLANRRRAQPHSDGEWPAPRCRGHHHEPHLRRRRQRPVVHGTGQGEEPGPVPYLAPDQEGLPGARRGRRRCVAGAPRCDAHQPAQRWAAPRQEPRPGDHTPGHLVHQQHTATVGFRAGDGVPEGRPRRAFRRRRAYAPHQRLGPALLLRYHRDEARLQLHVRRDHRDRPATDAARPGGEGHRRHGRLHVPQHPNLRRAPLQRTAQRQGPRRHHEHEVHQIGR
ncbi:hypothetical protein ACJX0J_020495, partial [Zea mays]